MSTRLAACLPPWAKGLPEPFPHRNHVGEGIRYQKELSMDYVMFECESVTCKDIILLLIDNCKYPGCKRFT